LGRFYFGRMRSMIDDLNVTRILRLISKNDYLVTVNTDTMTATHGRTGEMFMVRGDDPLTMAPELAVQVGIDLMDR
jgi:hypothetical protein